MTTLRYTLLSDGPTDAALLPVLRFLLHENGVSGAVEGIWADLARVSQRPTSLMGRIAATLEYYPCDLLFVHRDAERDDTSQRYHEIANALEAIQKTTIPPAVCVVPKRMTEAWLLIDEQAIRRASGNPNGKVEISMPALRQIENLPDPKETLNALIRIASGLSGRHLTKFYVPRFAERVADYVEDFSPLRRLPAFQSLESDLREVIEREGWSDQPV